jgi:hypothetical protein
VGVCVLVLSLEVVDGEAVSRYIYAYHRATARSFWCGGSGHSSTIAISRTCPACSREFYNLRRLFRQIQGHTREIQHF